jgi:DNA-binding transcriptional ArsR family regulator
MLEGLLGNPTAEKVLLFLEQYEEGYAREIAKQFDGIPLSMVQRQLERLEAGGVVVSQLRGRTRLFRWNPRFAFLDELRRLLRAVLGSVSAEDRRRYFSSRRRPRRTGKPL